MCARNRKIEDVCYHTPRPSPSTLPRHRYSCHDKHESVLWPPEWKTANNELTWPAGLQQELQEDHRAKSRAAQRGHGGTPRPLRIRVIMLGRLEKLHDTRYMTPSDTQRDGGPFGISLESLAAQGVCLEMGALRAVMQKQ